MRRVLILDEGCSKTPTSLHLGPGKDNQEDDIQEERTVCLHRSSICFRLATTDLFLSPTSSFLLLEGYGVLPES